MDLTIRHGVCLGDRMLASSALAHPIRWAYMHGSKLRAAALVCMMSM